MSLPNSKRKTNEANDEICNKTTSIIETFLKDVKKKSVTKQIIIGASSGWVTGFVASKIGKVTAFALGGGIIILQVAAENGYIKINWDKIQTKAEKIADKFDEAVSDENPNMIDKVITYWKSNNLLACCFIGGFIIGLAT